MPDLSDDRLSRGYAADIRSARARLDESQEVFGHRFGVSRRTVQKWEAGSIPRPKFRRLLDVLFAELGGLAA